LFVARHEQHAGEGAPHGGIDAGAPGDHVGGRGLEAIGEAADLVALIDREHRVAEPGADPGGAGGQGKGAAAQKGIREQIPALLPVGPQNTAAHPADEEGGMGEQASGAAPAEEFGQPPPGSGVVTARARFEMLPAEEEPHAVEAEIAHDIEVVPDFGGGPGAPQLDAAGGGPVIHADGHDAPAGAGEIAGGGKSENGFNLHFFLTCDGLRVAWASRP
jgi:hypothetical protein